MWIVDDVRKARTQVVGLIIIGIVMLVNTGFDTFVTNAKKGGEALRRVEALEPRVDTLYFRQAVIINRQVLKESETEIRLSNAVDDIVEIKDMMKTMYEYNTGMTYEKKPEHK